MKLFNLENKRSAQGFGSAFFRNEVKSAHLGAKPYPPEKILKSYQRYFDKSLPDFINRLTPATSLQTLREKAQSTVTSAEKLIKGEWRLFNREIKISSATPDWNYDYINGFQFPVEYIWDDLLDKLIPGSDPVNGWETARFHQLYDIALSYSVTKDEKFAEYYFSLINSFINSSPFCKGINWYDTTEVCIRAVNIMLSLPYVSRSPHFNSNKDKLNWILLSSLLMVQNIPFTGNNDYRIFARILFQLLFSLLYKGDSLSEELRDKAIKLFNREIETQINSDGSLKNNSTAAYVHTLESVTLYLLLSEKFNFIVNKKASGKVSKFSLAFRDITGGKEGIFTSGKLPFSRFFSAYSGKYDFRHKELNLILSEILNGVSGADADSLLTGFIFPGFSVKVLRDDNSRSGLQSAGFSDGGKYFLRDENTDIAISIRSSRSDLPRDVTYDDILSYELSYKGQRFVVNPGTYSYFKEPELNAKMRTAWFHNTFLLDNTPSINDNGGNDLSKSKIIEWNTTDEQDNLVVINHAFVRLADPVICKRGLYFDKREKKFTIKDEFIGGAFHQITGNINLHPDVKIDKISVNEYLLNNKGINVSVKFIFPSVKGSVSIKDSHYSPAYNELYPSSRLTLTIEERLPSFYIIEYGLK